MKVERNEKIFKNYQIKLLRCKFKDSIYDEYIRPSLKKKCFLSGFLWKSVLAGWSFLFFDFLLLPNEGIWFKVQVKPVAFVHVDFFHMKYKHKRPQVMRQAGMRNIFFLLWITKQFKEVVTILPWSFIPFYKKKFIDNFLTVNSCSLQCH